MLGRNLLAWIPMVFIAVANGAFRDFVLMRRLREPVARQISTVILLALFTIYIRAVSRRWSTASARDAAARGAIWLLLTVGFEFTLGAASGKTLREMLEDYNIADGHLWPLVPAWLAIAPFAFRERTRAFD